MEILLKNRILAFRGWI